ncbi:MAG: manganese efflux pump MntP family protein [Proteobacteria bacterium]|nr:manganese efflux pump MntP family protein [Pseudomonadota bacterium]
MTLFNIMAIAVALAMDAFAVSIASGIILKKVSLRQTLRLSWHFGLFQALMPVLGWSLGVHVISYIEKYDHWIAFGLLLMVGGKMLVEAFAEKDDDAPPPKDPTKSIKLIVLSVATSIDALAIGFTLSVLNVSIVYPALVIGIVAALFTAVGINMGARLGNMTRLSRYTEILGGLVLIVIGINILHGHGVFSL